MTRKKHHPTSRGERLQLNKVKRKPVKKKDIEDELPNGRDLD